MSAKSKKPVENIEIEGELLNEVSYATYYLGLQLFTAFKIFNRAEDNLDSVTVSITG